MLIIIVGTIYSLLYNDGRWVKKYDMSEYVFFLQGYSHVSNWSFNSTICYLYSNYLFKNVFSQKQQEKRY